MEAANCNTKLTKKFTSVSVSYSFLQQFHIDWRRIIFHVNISFIQTCYFLFKSHIVAKIWTVTYVEYFSNSLETYLAEHFVWRSYHSTCCNFLNIKLRHGYFSANITKSSEQVSLKHLQEHSILLISKSEYMLSLVTSNHYKLYLF